MTDTIDRAERRTSSTTFTYHDPGRTFDGTPYEAAGKAVEQAASLNRLQRRALLDTAVQVRNAYMQRNLDLGGSPEAADWEDAPEAKLLASFLNANAIMQTKLKALYRAATYDPAHPPKD